LDLRLTATRSAWRDGRRRRKKVSRKGKEPDQGPRLYRDLADWYPLLTPGADYVEEAAFYRRLFEAHCQRQPRTLLDLGSGGGHNAAHLAGPRGLRYLEWRWVPESSHETYVTDMAYLLRDERGTAEIFHDRHVMGLFPRAVWLALIGAAGFEPLAVPFEHSSYSNNGHEVFLGLRPDGAAGT